MVDWKGWNRHGQDSGFLLVTAVSISLSQKCWGWEEGVCLFVVVAVVVVFVLHLTPSSEMSESSKCWSWTLYRRRGRMLRSLTLGLRKKCGCASVFEKKKNETFVSLTHARPRGLTFTWWGCCGLCFDINQPSLTTPFYCILVSISVFMALSTAFYSINSPELSLSYAVLPVLYLPYWSFHLYISLWKSPSDLI